MSKINKVVFLSYSKLTKKILSEYSINNFLEKNIIFEYIDLTELLRKDHIDNGMINDYKYYVKIDSYIDLIKYLKKNRDSDCVYFVNIPIQFKFLLFYSIITFYKIDTWIIMNFGNPSFLVKRGFFQKLVNHIIHPSLFFNILINNIFYKLVTKFNIIKKHSITFCVGLAELNNNHHTVKKISINSSDYEKACLLEDVNRINTNENGKIIFLDIFLPFHNDLDLSKDKRVNPEIYYNELNNFFIKLEEFYENEIIIAAHPTAIYKNNPFQGRKIIYNNTNELVKYSSFVISHWSTSVNYAIIYKKPILFFYTSEMLIHYRFSHILSLISYSNSLSQKLVYVNDNNIFDSNFIINEKLYSNYIEKYISFNTGNKKNIDIFLTNLFL